MGKCLSCSEEPREVDGTSPNNSERKTEAHSRLSIGQTGVSSRPGSGDIDQLQNNRNSRGSGGGGTTASVPPNNEKRTFYPRIPPILSVGSENKKATQSKECSETKIVALYEQYKDPNEDAILSEGIEKFCQDLEVKPEEFKVLVLAWKFGAETMCRFTRPEFVSGCKLLKTSSVKGIQGKFPEMLQEVQDPEKFKDFYRFTFKFGLDSEIGQRILPTDMAISLWKLVFSQKEPPLLKRWLAFLEKHPSVRGIPRDTWNMFLNFLESVGDDLSTYDDAEAWPSLFDDFVEYENDQTNQNVQHKETREGCDLE